MEDKNGLYYYPFPQNKRVRMYVKKENGIFYFRLWNSDDEMLWKDHDWVPYEAIKQAAAMYSGKNFNPSDAYNIDIAKTLLKDAESDHF